LSYGRDGWVVRNNKL